MILNKKNLILFILLWIINYISSYELDFIPYQGKLKRIITKNFIIIFPKKQLEIAKKVAFYCEDIHSKLIEFFKWKPYEKTTVILTDHTDMPNGLGYPFFRNTIVLHLAPFDLERTLENMSDPLYTLIVHEYSHVLHLDQIREAAIFWRILYGKLYSPNSGSFPWYMEGVAVLTESIFSPDGRLNESYNDVFVREKARNNKLPNFDEIVSINLDAYQLGGRFISYLYTAYGKEKLQEFFTDISNDFWPFILLFVSKFRKIYKKSLKDLWNEWREYEKERAKEYYENNKEKQLNRKKVIPLIGRIYSIDEKNGIFYISNSGYKNESGIYQYNSLREEFKKIKNGYIYSLSTTDNDEYLLYTKPVLYTGEFYYYELFLYNLKNKKEKRLTYKKRISFVSFCKNKNIGILVSNQAQKAKIYIIKIIKEKLVIEKEITFENILEFIDQPSISPNGEKVIFAAKDSSNFFRPYSFNINDNSLTLLDENLNVKKLKWIDDKRFTCIAKNENKKNNFLCIYDLEQKTTLLVEESFGYFYDFFYLNNKIYFVEYSLNGDEFFIIEKLENDFKSFENRLPKLKKIQVPEIEYRLKNYNAFRYIYPAIWGFLIYQTNSNFYFKAGNVYLQIPFIAPQFILYNSTPLGRFTYIATVGYNYMKNYPDNTFSFRLKLPFLHIIYEWSNWAGGEKHIIGNNIFTITKDGKFPINFANKLELYYFYRIETINQIGWDFTFYHNFSEYDFNYNKLTNKIGFNISLNYGLARKIINYSRWNSGLFSKIESYIYPHFLLDNSPVYLLKGEVEYRVPMKKSFYYFIIKIAKEFLNQNYFIAKSDIFSFSDIFLYEKVDYINVIDMKAFPSGLTTASLGNSFIYFENGFDISLYKKEKYWHFLTMGFRELYLKPYFQFLYLNNQKNKILNNFLFDFAIETAVDLFVSYGNISFTFVLGNALGYRILDLLPTWNVYSYLSIGIL